MVSIGGHLLVNDAEHVARGHDVQRRQTQHALRVVLGQPVGDASAAVVAAQEEGVEPQVAHGVHQVLRLRPLGVVEVVGAALGLAAVAVAAQVRRDYREVLRQPRRDLVPHGMRLRVTVQQQERRAAAALHQVDDFATAGGNLHPVESFE